LNSFTLSFLIELHDTKQQPCGQSFMLRLTASRGNNSSPAIALHTIAELGLASDKNLVARLSTGKSKYEVFDTMFSSNCIDQAS
jgi:hypothetical protein